MDAMAATQSFTWADAAGAAVVAVAVVALVGFAVAGFVQLRTAKIKAGQEDDLRQLVRRYENWPRPPSTPSSARPPTSAEMRARSASIEQILRTVE